MEKEVDVSGSGIDIHQPKNYRGLRFVAVFAAMCGVGLTSSSLGPTLVSMEMLLKTGTKSISMSFIGGSTGGLVGAIVSGFVYPRLNKELLFAGSMIGSGVITALAPWAPHLYIFIGAITIQQFFNVAIATASQCYILESHGSPRLKRQLMQTLHGFVSIGATSGPFIIKPFLVDIDNDMVQHYVNTTHNITYKDLQSLQDHGNLVINNSDSAGLNVSHEFEPRKDVEIVRYAYALLASIVLLFSTLFIALFILKCHAIEDRQKTESPIPRQGPRKPSKFFTVALLIFMFIFYYFLRYIEGIPGTMLATFAVIGLGWPNAQGALVTSAFWGSHGASRFVGIIISRVMQPRNMLIMDLAITACGFTILLFVEYHYSVLWVSIALAGFGIGTIFPSTILWLREHIEITGAASSILLAASCVGGMTGPTLTAFLFNDFGRMWFTYMCSIAIFTDIFIFGISYMFTRRCRIHNENNSVTQNIITSCEVNNINYSNKLLQAERLAISCQSLTAI